MGENFQVFGEMDSSNRTVKELKYIFVKQVTFGNFTSNRTVKELKYKNLAWIELNWSTSNRTVKELKSDSLGENGNVYLLLIVP